MIWPSLISSCRHRWVDTALCVSWAMAFWAEAERQACSPEAWAESSKWTARTRCFSNASGTTGTRCECSCGAHEHGLCCWLQSVEWTSKATSWTTSWIAGEWTRPRTRQATWVRLTSQLPLWSRTGSRSRCCYHFFLGSAGSCTCSCCFRSGQWSLWRNRSRWRSRSPSLCCRWWTLSWPPSRHGVLMDMLRAECCYRGGVLRSRSSESGSDLASLNARVTHFHGVGDARDGRTFKKV